VQSRGNHRDSSKDYIDIFRHNIIVLERRKILFLFLQTKSAKAVKIKGDHEIIAFFEGPYISPFFEIRMCAFELNLLISVPPTHCSALVHVQ